MNYKFLPITLLTLLGFSAEAIAQAVAQTPQLVVSIAVDQLRSDHMEAYASLYGKAGLKRLLSEGVVYPNASYSFRPVDRASASAAITTGTTPYYNSITGLEWLSRTTLRPQSILKGDSPTFPTVQIATSTLGDELKIATGGLRKVFAFATSPECAILSAGHAADGAAWVSSGSWQTAACYEPQNVWLSSYTRQYLPGTDANRSVTDIALKCVEQLGIGDDDKTDLLCLGYSVSPTPEGYRQLDSNMEQLMNGILTKVAASRVLFVLTSLGTTEEDREDKYAQYHIPTGKFYINRTANLLNMYLGALHGTAAYVETSFRNQLFLNHKTIDKKSLDVGLVLRQSQEFLLQIPGIRNVFTAKQLLTSDSPLLQLIRNGFNTERCGDLLIDIAPGWQLINEDTHTTVTSRASSIPFPIIFFWTYAKPERIMTPVTVDRIAPTVTRAIRIRAPNACAAEPLF